MKLLVRRTEEELDQGGGGCVRISVEVPSNLRLIEQATDVVTRHCLACGIPHRAARFNLRLALTEALANAIIYGNQQDPGKRVDIRVEIGERRVEMHVRDEGNGFNPRAVPDPTSPGRIEREDGRGLFLIRQLVDDVFFNDRGNSICMVLLRA